MAEKYKEEERRIALALTEFSESLQPNLNALAQKYDVPIHRLRRRAVGKASKTTCPKTNQKLTPEQLRALELYIKRLDALGQPPLLPIWRSATEFIQKKTSSPGTILKPLGHDFFKRYEAANTHIKKMKQKPKELNRVVSQEREVIIEYFRKYEDICRMHGILPCDQYNFDETGFSIGVGGQQYVVTMDLAKKCAESPSDSNRDHVSLVETVSADGSVLPPLCIMKGVVVLFQHVSNYLNLDPNMPLATSESGYSNDQIALSFIRHFDKFSALRQRGAWRLLIFDGHGSHLTYEFITYCWDNKIIPFGLPSHTSHILQPLDVVIF
jgi:hypothetical protein